MKNALCACVALGSSLALGCSSSSDSVAAGGAGTVFGGAGGTSMGGAPPPNQSGAGAPASPGGAASGGDASLAGSTAFGGTSAAGATSTAGDASGGSSSTAPTGGSGGAPAAGGSPSAGTGGASAQPSGLLFDDFSYTGTSDPGFLANWKASDYSPAAPGLGSFSKNNVKFLPDSDASNTLMRVSFTTSGARENTVEGEVEGQRRFLYGTYASRVRFYNQPLVGDVQVVGPDTGDHVVCTFFTISPYYVPNTEYGELDFEYLPMAGWNGDGPRFTTATMWNTTWKTRDVRITKPTAQDSSGWHLYWMTASATAVSYYMDEKLLVTHTDASYIPKTEMLIMYNLWLTGEQFAQGQNGKPRTWAEDVDWLYHVKDKALTFADVQAAVTGYRSRSIKKVDTMPPPIPPPANL